MDANLRAARADLISQPFQFIVFWDLYPSTVFLIRGIVPTVQEATAEHNILQMMNNLASEACRSKRARLNSHPDAISIKVSWLPALLESGLDSETLIRGQSVHAICI